MKMVFLLMQMLEDQWTVQEQRQCEEMEFQERPSKGF